MREELVAQGAEAVLIRKGDVLLKRRNKKRYRITEMDEKIRKLRTRGEAKLLEKAGKIIGVPKVLRVDEGEKEIDMEFIDGLKLSDKLDEMKNQKEVCLEIGRNIAKLHDAGIIHGDLTTSNMIWVQLDSQASLIDKARSARKLSHHRSEPLCDRENNFSKLLNELKKLDLPNNEFAVFGSGPMAVRGIKDSGDLDIVVKSQLWVKLTKGKVIKDGTYEKNSKIEIGNIEVYKNWKPWFPNSDELIDESDIFDGIRFVKLEKVLDWKRSFNREKDKGAVKLIEDYLSSKKGKLYFIDFGLGFANGRIEDKAVDLYLIKEALEAKHFKRFEKYFEAVLKGYKETSKHASEVLKRLEKVEKRGRYKQNY